MLVGDPQQLQAHSEFFAAHLPAAQGGLLERLGCHSRSAMERLTGSWAAAGAAARASVRLRTQYRMHNAVCTLIDRQFYSGRCGTGRVRRIPRCCTPGIFERCCINIGGSACRSAKHSAGHLRTALR